jgi:3-methyladenine DNA glycosylase AlkD
VDKRNSAHAPLMADVVQRVRMDLQRSSDEKVRASGSRFFKEEVRMYGVKTAVATRIGKEHFKAVRHQSKSEIFALCEELWRSGVMEESFIASQWAYALRDRFEPGDFDIFEHWVNDYVSNWAACDTLCNHTGGELVMRFPEVLPRLFSWAESPNLWTRRAAAVTLIIPARRGMFLPEIFRIADILLHDSEDLVQKGYGWMLKAASETHGQEVFEYVMRRKNEMPRTALRYAIEKMDKQMRAQAMKKGV